MASIPKKILDRFQKSIPKFQKVFQLAKDKDINESDTATILQDVFQDVFGYDKYLEVTTELAIRNTYCDIALKVDEKVQWLIEVKAIGISLKEQHVKQAIDYGANHGIPWVILTNGIEWRIHRIRFEQPINFDLVDQFDITEIKASDSKVQQILWMISKESLPKNARQDYYERTQSINKYVVASMLQSDQVLRLLRRELKKFSDGVNIDEAEILEIISEEVLKREVVESESAKASTLKVKKYFKKIGDQKSKKLSTQPKRKSGLNDSVNEENSTGQTQNLSKGPDGENTNTHQIENQ